MTDEELLELTKKSIVMDQDRIRDLKATACFFSINSGKPIVMLCTLPWHDKNYDAPCYYFYQGAEISKEEYDRLEALNPFW